MQKLNYEQGTYKCLPAGLIEHSIKHGYDKTLVYFIWMKANRHRPAFNNFTYRSLAKDLGVSTATLTKHIPIMLKHDLIRFEGKHLICNGTTYLLKKFKQKIKCLVPVKLHLTKKSNQHAYIRWVVTYRNLSYQEKAIENKEAILKLTNSNQYVELGRAKKLIKQRARLEEKLPKGISLQNSLRHNMMLSNNRLGKLIGTNKQGGQKFQKQLRDLGLIRSKSVFIKTGMTGLTPKMLPSYSLPTSYLVSTEGSLVRQRANEITIVNSRYPKMNTN